MDEPSVNVFKNIENRTELGTHLHAEFIEPMSNFHSETTDHFQSDFSIEIELEKLKNLTELFIETFGYQPTSFRAGRFGISDNSLEILQDLGYLVDSSVTPDAYWSNTSGNFVNHIGADYQPYYPSKQDHRKKGRLKVLQVPISTMNTFLRPVPKWIKRLFEPRKRWQRIGFYQLSSGRKPHWLRPTFSDTEKMIYTTDLIISKSRQKQVFLCMMFHSNEFTCNTSPYSLTKESVLTLQNRLDQYFYTLRQDYDVSFIGLSEIKNYF